MFVYCSLFCCYVCCVPFVIGCCLLLFVFLLFDVRSWLLLGVGCCWLLFVLVLCCILLLAVCGVFVA